MCVVTLCTTERRLGTCVSFGFIRGKYVGIQDLALWLMTSSSGPM